VRWRWLVTATALLCVGLWWSWPTLTRSSSADVLVVGDGAVGQATDEIARRFRQEGNVVEVLVAEDGCTGLPADIGGAERIVVSFAQWDGCGPWPGAVSLLVQQPGGGDPRAVADGRRARLATDLFTGADRVPCEWWDTPGDGEQRPGLGRCEVDGMVTVIEDEVLTDAGRERFARLVVESAG
jgi:hypothetical protein